MLQAIAHAGLLQQKDVVADGLYGQSRTCSDAVDACVGVTTFVAIPSETRRAPTPPNGGQDLPLQETRQACGGHPTHAPSSVAALAAHLPASRWSQRTVSEGTTGPIGYACPPPRTLCTEGLPDRTVWLVSKRTVGANPVRILYQSCASEHALAHRCLAQGCGGRSSPAAKQGNGTRDGSL